MRLSLVKFMLSNQITCLFLDTAAHWKNVSRGENFGNAWALAKFETIDGRCRMRALWVTATAKRTKGKTSTEAGSGYGALQCNPVNSCPALQATASRASYGQASSTAAPTITQAIWITGVSVTQTMLIPTPLVCAVSRIWKIHTDALWRHFRARCLAVRLEYRRLPGLILYKLLSVRALDRHTWFRRIL